MALFHSTLAPFHFFVSPFYITHVFIPFQGVENVYTRHKPLLADTLDQLVKERLSETDYPYCGEFRLADKLVCHLRIFVCVCETF